MNQLTTMTQDIRCNEDDHGKNDLYEDENDNDWYLKDDNDQVYENDTKSSNGTNATPLQWKYHR